MATKDIPRWADTAFITGGTQKTFAQLSFKPLECQLTSFSSYAGLFLSSGETSEASGFEDRSDERLNPNISFDLWEFNKNYISHETLPHMVHPVDFDFDDCQCQWTNVQEMMFNYSNEI